MTNVTFLNNSAGAGGGIANDGSNVSTTLTKVLFLNNFANTGAGLFTNGSLDVITNVFFSENLASESGGGIYHSGSSSLTLTNVVFSQNSALSSKGGGLYSSSSSTVALTNVAFSQNSADLEGAAIYSDVNSAGVTVSNTLFYGNTAGGSLSDISGNSIHSASTNNTSDVTGGGISTTNLFVPLTADPFMDVNDVDGVDNILGTRDDGLFLKEDSSLRDAGKQLVFSEYDITGVARLNSPSIGAYEAFPKNITIAPKVFLQGAYVATDGLMTDTLRGDGNFATGTQIIPLTSPYTIANGYPAYDAAADQSVFTVTGNNAIVDWVYVELRDKTDIGSVLLGSSALLQRDGDVVGIDGGSVLDFEMEPGDYYISISHRNHIAVVKDATIALTSTSQTIDFTNAIGSIRGGNSAMVELETGVYRMYGGNSEGSGQVQTTTYFNTIPFLGASGYSNYDVNMDGQIQTIDLSFIISLIGKGIQF